jgi:hypothetical protein
MSSNPDRQIIIELVVRTANPALLEGLDMWLRLGLLSDSMVRRICEQKLVCAVPPPLTAPTPALEAESTLQTTPLQTTALQNVALQNVGSQTDFLPPTESRSSPGSARPPVRSRSPQPERAPSLVNQAMQSFMAEVSVIWLLFLGVFLVVVSSGVLAATQWRNVSPIGQYAILFAYTTVFWLVSTWTSRQERLQLTTRMLKIAALLLVPVNFWMIDGFRLWNSGMGIAVAGIAALLLTFLTLHLLKPNPSWGMTGTAIALSWLHWGWSWQGLPFAAVYLGTIGAAVAIVLQDQDSRIGRTAEQIRAAAEPSEAPPQSRHHTAPPLNTIAVTFSAFLLIGRALLMNKVPVEQLGLAIGMSGWVIGWLARRDRAWQLLNIGGILLLLGWAISINTTPPWQAVVISGLAIWLLIDRLRRYSNTDSLTILWLVGLQICWLLWRMIPEALQQQIVDFAQQFAGTQGLPIALLGLGLFPYVLFTIVAAVQFRHWQQPALALRNEQLALGLGIILVGISCFNPGVRTLNLILSTVTLLWVGRKRPLLSPWLVYLIHATGIAAISSLINWQFPTLNANHWAAISTASLLGEWLACAWGTKQEAQRQRRRRASEPATTSFPAVLPAISSPWLASTWHYGVAFAVLSYLLLWNEFAGNQLFNTSKPWGWLSLAAPIALTILGHLPRFMATQLASWLSVVAVIFMQPFLFSSPLERFASLAIATLLMVLNTRQLRHWLAAILTIGFSLTFASILISDTAGKSLTFAGVLCLLAIATLLLWLFRGWLLPKPGVLAKIYRDAVDGWAIAIAFTTLLTLSLWLFLIYINLDSPDWRHSLSAAILFGATSYRTYRSRKIAFHLSLLAAAWSLELVALSGISLFSRSTDKIGIANLALGLATQLIGNQWIAQWTRHSTNSRSLADTSDRPTPPAQPSSTPSPQPNNFFSLHLIPLLYAALGLLLQHSTFTATTGLYTLIAALIGIGIGRRQPSLKGITVLSLFIGSVGAFELLIYQLSQAKGGSGGDAIVLCSALALGLAVLYHLGRRILLRSLRLTTSELLTTAHVHWFVSNGLLAVALALPLSNPGKWLWIGISAALAAYALGMGNLRWFADSNRRNAEQPTTTAASPPNRLLPATTWTFVGILEFLVAFAHALYLIIPLSTLVDWAGAIAAIIAVLLYISPWQRWNYDWQPARAIATILPGTIIVLMSVGTNIQSLLIVAAFYAWLATVESQPRISYLSILLGDWAILRWLNILGSNEPLFYATILGLSVLYLAQVDPALTNQEDREKRHWVRCAGSGLMCLTAFYQSQIGITELAPVLVGFIAIAFQLSFILAGIFLRIRAFLYVGTATFLIQVLWQSWSFVSDYSPLLWALGIVAGLALIWIAATFEARRTQMNTLLQQWMTELNNWD